MKSLVLLILALSSVAFAGASVEAKPRVPRSLQVLRFEVDGKPINEPIRVILYLYDSQIEVEVEVKENRFELPERALELERVGVRIICGKYDLLFDTVYLSHFEVDWVVGVDHPPFTADYVEPKEAATLEKIYYIKFMPRDADGTQLVVWVPKRQTHH